MLSIGVRLTGGLLLLIISVIVSAQLIGRFWPDRGELIYTRPDRTYNSDIYIRDIDSGIEVNLTRSPVANENYPALSPDGRTIAFIGNRPASDYEAAQGPLYVMDWTGGNLRSIPDVTTRERRLASINPMRWTGDGENLIIMMKEAGTLVGNPNHLYRVNIAGNGIDQISDLPDLRETAPFAWNDTEQTALILGLEPNFYRVYRADVGSSRADGLISYNVSFDRVTVFPLLSPDGRSFLVSASPRVGDSSSVFRFDLDERQPAEIYANSEVDVFRLAWSPDGERIAFVTAPAGTFNQPPYTLSIMNRAGSDLIELGTIDISPPNDALMWSPDGRYLLYSYGDSHCIIAVTGGAPDCFSGLMGQVQWRMMD